MAFLGHNMKKFLVIRRDLRKRQTDAETLLWSCVRRRRLQGFKFHRQYGVGRYILDFYCHDARLGIELDGGQHNDDVVKANDAERTRYLNACGIEVIRFWNNELFQDIDAVLERIAEKLLQTGPRLPRPPLSEGDP